MGTVRSAVGSAQLLIAQKFQQFRGLCDENLVSSINPTNALFLWHISMHLFQSQQVELV